MVNRKYNLEKYIHGKNHHKRRTNRNKVPERAFRQGPPGNNSGYKIVDLHNLALHNAKNRIKEELRDARADGLPGIKFVHGFNGGTAIREWMRDNSLQQFLDDSQIPGRIWYEEEGSTSVSITSN